MNCPGEALPAARRNGEVKLSMDTHLLTGRNQSRRILSSWSWTILFHCMIWPNEVAVVDHRQRDMLSYCRTGDSQKGGCWYKDTAGNRHWLPMNVDNYWVLILPSVKCCCSWQKLFSSPQLKWPESMLRRSEPSLMPDVYVTFMSWASWEANREGHETGDDGSCCSKLKSVPLCLCSAWPLNSAVCRPVGCLPEMLWWGRDVQDAGTDYDFNISVVNRCGVTRQLCTKCTKDDSTFTFLTKLPNVLGRPKSQHLVPKPQHLVHQLNSLISLQSQHWSPQQTLCRTYCAVRGRKEWQGMCTCTRNPTARAKCVTVGVTQCTPSPGDAGHMQSPLQ